MSRSAICMLAVLIGSASCSDRSAGPPTPAAPDPAPPPAVDPLELALSELTEIEKAANRYTRERGTVPSVAALIEPIGDLEPYLLGAGDVPRDPWRCTYLIRALEGGENAFEVVSAGPDRVLDTDDDLVRRSTRFAPNAEPTGPRDAPDLPHFGIHANKNPEFFGVCMAARDPATGDLGVVALGTWPGSAARMARLRLGAGVAITAFRPRLDWLEEAIDGLARDESPAAVVERLTATDGTHNTRHLLVWDARTGAGKAFAGTIAAESFVAASRIESDHCVVISHLRKSGIDRAMSERFTALAELPLPERLLLACEPALDEEARIVPFRSASLTVLRDGADPITFSDTLVDVAEAYHSDPFARLRSLYELTARTSLPMLLRAQQLKEADTATPRAVANREWLKRLRQGRLIGN